MKRDLRIDSVKGILLILVILGHVIEVTDNSSFSQKLYDFIYLFHMPLFIYVSGFLTKRKDDFKAFLSGLAYILIPYVIFQSVHVAALLLQGESFSMMYHSLIIMYVLTPAIHRFHLPHDCIAFSLTYTLGILGLISVARRFRPITFLASPLKR